jgi:hypothetical protein
MRRHSGDENVVLLAEIETDLNLGLPYIRMYGKVSRSFFLFFLFHIDHIVATICQFVGVQLRRGS